MTAQDDVLTEQPLDDYAELVEQYRDAVSEAEKAEARKQLLKEQLLKLIGDAHVGTVGGSYVLRHVHTSPTYMLDTAKLKRRLPDVYRQYETKVRAGSDYLKFMS